jgi:hypothetical protein
MSDAALHGSEPSARLRRLPARPPRHETPFTLRVWAQLFAALFVVVSYYLAEYLKLRAGGEAPRARRAEAPPVVAAVAGRLRRDELRRPRGDWAGVGAGREAFSGRRPDLSTAWVLGPAQRLRTGDSGEAIRS